MKTFNDIYSDPQDGKYYYMDLSEDEHGPFDSKEEAERDRELFIKQHQEEQH